MSDSDPSSSSSGYGGPKARVPQRINATDIVAGGGGPTDALGRFNATPFSDRTSFAKHLSGANNETAQLFDLLNYPATYELTYHAFAWMYTRSTFARTIIDKVSGDTWQDAPTIRDTGRRDDDRETDFERGCRKLINGDTLRRGLSHRWFVADQENRIGEYSVLVLTTADDHGGDLTEPLPEDAFTGSLADRLDSLWHVQVYGEHRVQMSEMVTDVSSRRYGLPEIYEVTPDEGETQSEDVHHSRVIHLAEGARTNDLYGESALLPVFNRLEDIERLLGGSSEMFWQGAFPGLVASPPILQDADGGDVLADFEGSKESLNEQVEEYRQTLNRVIATGAEIETLDPNIESPAEHIDVQLQAISAGTSPTIPKKMLVGKETGERASSEDRNTYHEGIRSRRKNFAESQVVRPTIDLLVRAGVIPEPEGGDYVVEWPPLDPPTKDEMASRRDTMASAIQKAADAATVAPEYADQIWQKVGIDTTPDSAGTGMDMASGATASASASQSPSSTSGAGPENSPSPTARANADGDPMDAYPERANATNINTGDVVATPDGKGVVVGELRDEFEFPTGETTEDDDNIETVSASRDDPAYIVGFGGRSAVYRASALEPSSFDDEEAPTTTDGDRVAGPVSAYEFNPDEWPEGWERTSVLSYYATAGGTFTELAEAIEDTDAFSTEDARGFAAEMKSQIAGTQRWRGRW